MPLIALLTDFGMDDWYVASMKGAIARIAPRARVVDITHTIPMGDVSAAAFALLASHTDFPPETTFVVVVDPGVGSERLPLIARARRCVFLGPDNGVLAPCLAADPSAQVRKLSNPVLRRTIRSSVFHGRDIFAPAAAHVATGVSLRSFGPLVKTYRRTILPKPSARGGTVRGRVVYIDRFGNAISNIPVDLVKKHVRRKPGVSVRNRRMLPLLSYYSQAEAGGALALEGSCGFVEISVNQGSAASKLGIRVGDMVVVSPHT